jgi:streptogramin lyase
VSRIDPQTLQITSPWQAPAGSASIATGAGAVWVADGFRARVLRFDPVTAAVREISVATGTTGSGSRLSSVSVGGSPREYVWVVDALGTAVYRIDPADTTAQQTFQIAGTPTQVAVAGGTVWITSEPGDKLFELDASSGATRTTVDLARAGCNAPTGIAIGSGGVWVSCSLSGNVVEVSSATAQVLASLPVNGSPDAMTVDDQGRVWVAVHSA